MTTRLEDDWTSPAAALGVDPESSGVNTFRDYKYQAKVAFSWALHLAIDDENSKKRLKGLIAEVHEDFIAVWVDKVTTGCTMELVQVKDVNATITSTSDIVRRYKLAELFIRHSKLPPLPDTPWHVSLATHAPLPSLKKALVKHAQSPELLPGDPANFVKQIAKKVLGLTLKTSGKDEDVSTLGDTDTDEPEPAEAAIENPSTKEDINEQIKKFLRDLVLWSDFPAPQHIDLWNMHRLYKLRVQRGGVLTSIEDDYEACLKELEAAFSGASEHEKAMRLLGERPTQADRWKIALESRSLEAERLLQLVHGGEILADQAHEELEQRYANALLEVRKFAEAFANLRSTVDMKNAINLRNPPSTGPKLLTLAPYLPYLPLATHKAVNHMLDQVQQGATVEEITGTVSVLLQNLGDNDAPPDVSESTQETDEEHRYITGLENLQYEEDAEFFRTQAQAIGPALASVTPSARRLLWNLIRRGRQERDSYTKLVRTDEEAELLGVATLAQFGLLAEELSFADLAEWEDEYEGRPGHFTTTMRHGFYWSELGDHLRVCGGSLEAFIVGLHTRVLHSPV